MNAILRQNGITVLANAMPSQVSPKSRLIISIRDDNGRDRPLAIPRSVVASRTQLKTALLDAGLPFQSDARIDEIQSALQECSDYQYSAVGRPGFHGTVYLTAANTVIGEAPLPLPFLDPDSKLLLPATSDQGTLEEWQRQVAMLATHSSRLMLSLCAAFSAYLIRWADIETGGFHLWGDSSIGKSTCLYTAVSVHGPREAVGFWSTTNAAMEETASAHTDLILALDELKLLSESPTQAAQLATNIIYKLATGQGKRRSSVYQDPSTQKAQRWQTILLSTGELSLSDHAKQGGPERMLGEEVRVPDVPADSGAGLGIFESLPDECPTPQAAAEVLSEKAHRYYGTAQVAFLGRLTRYLRTDEQKLRKRIQKRIEYFLDQNGVDRNSGYKARLAKRFALAYAAGIFAVNYKVLPFEKEQVFEAVCKCYNDALNARRPHSERVREGYERVLEQVRTMDVVDLRVCPKKRKSSKQRGYITKVEGKSVIAVPRKLLMQIIGDEAIARSVLRKFVKEGVLLPDAAGKVTRAITIPGATPAKQRHVCFLLKQVRRR